MTSAPLGHQVLVPEHLSTGYRLAAGALLYPEERDHDALTECRHALEGGPEGQLALLDAFFDSPRAGDPDEYLTLLELAPPCPLYLGSYLFEEPSTCRGAGISGRNAYMLELKAIYRHFGLEPNGAELADYLPLVVEFLDHSLTHPELDGIGLRRYLLERHVLPALPLLQAALEKYESPYAKLIEYLRLLVEDDAASCPDPAWDPVPAGAELPVIGAAGSRAPGRLAAKGKEGVSG